MKSKFILEFGSEALEDLNDVFSHYQSIRAGLANDFLTELYDKLELILQNPKCFALYFEDYRKLNLKRFEYSVVYYESNEKVVIVAIYHQKRQPYFWLERI